MIGPLESKRVLVTGATGNVGWGVAKAATNAGALVMLTTRSERSAETLSTEFPAASIIVADVATTGGSAAISQAITTVGSLDHVVAPIGSWWQRGASLDQAPTELDSLLSTYVGAQLRLTQITAPFLRASGGSYTLVTGAGGEHIIPGSGLLVVAVRSQFALADVLMNELRQDSFRFNEFRIDARVEPDARSGVVPSLTAGEAFVAVMAGDQRSELIRFTG